LKIFFILNDFIYKKELHQLIRVDTKIYPQLKEEIKLIEAVIENDT
jgi:hypothetical protein